MSEQQKEEIRNFYTAGYNPEDIAEMFNLDEVKVMEYCTEIL